MKQCTMNCGPAVGDKRSEEERRAECTDCLTIDVVQPDKYLEGDEYTNTMLSMRAYGGSFAQHIGQAAAVADSNNRQRLQDAFPELFEKYGPKSEFYKRYTKA